LSAALLLFLLLHEKEMHAIAAKSKKEDNFTIWSFLRTCKVIKKQNEQTMP
jgi:hypothetical protein